VQRQARLGLGHLHDHGLCDQRHHRPRAGRLCDRQERAHRRRGLAAGACAGAPPHAGALHAHAAQPPPWPLDQPQGEDHDQLNEPVRPSHSIAASTPAWPRCPTPSPQPKCTSATVALPVAAADEHQAYRSYVHGRPLPRIAQVREERFEPPETVGLERKYERPASRPPLSLAHDGAGSRRHALPRGRGPVLEEEGPCTG